MNLQEYKDHIAQQYGYKEWNEAIIKAPSLAVRMVDEITKLYASEKVKEALRTVARNVGVIFHDGTSKQETHHSQVMCGNNIIKPNRGGIIALESELLNKINKEI